MVEDSNQSRPLKVLIVGAGIGGLTAALGLRQQGHEVTLFERSQLAKETGAAIHLAPNCHGLLRRLGIFPESFGANPVCGITEYEAGGKIKFDIDLRQALSIWQHPWMLSHRVQLHEELKRKATGVEGPGTPAVLMKSSMVTMVDPSTATVTLENGSSFSGDLVLGADGVSSITRKIVAGPDIKPFGSGKSAFRFMIPIQQIQENPMTEKLTTREGYMTMWMGDDRRMVMYPCSNNTMMNFVGIHPSELSASKGEGWSRGVSKEVLLDVYSSFEPTIRALLEMVDINALKVWTLLDMARIPTWVKGRLALLGDAAHPFLPHQGQGGGIAIEDAASICTLLPLGTTADDIPSRLTLYEKQRDFRAHKVQEFTRMAGQDLNDANRVTFNIMEFMHYNFAHDEHHASTHALQRHLWSLRTNPPYYSRSPTSFGPSPSPRQNPPFIHPSQSHPTPSSPNANDAARFTTYTVRIRTSTTYLQTLFPSPQFRFSGPGTVAEASFVCTELRDLAWLGGGGYRFFGLWVHGVEYVRKDGGDESGVNGSWLVVLFEDRAEPIVTGREELGMPKVWCEIGVEGRKEEKEGKGVVVECGWGGKVFLRMGLEGLEHVEVGGSDGSVEGEWTKAPEGEGTMWYRYVPAVGSPGEADAEYAVMARDGASKTARKVERVRRTRNARLEFEQGDWPSLPTLHHIAAGLAEIPVYGIVEAKMEEGVGVDDLSHVQRIE